MSKNPMTLAEALHEDLRSLRATVVDPVAEQIRNANPQLLVSNGAIETALDEAFDKALSVDVFDVVTGGWRRWNNLQQTAVKSRSDDASHVVPLVEHSINVAYKPSIEVIVNGISVVTLHLTLEISLKLSGFRATLRRGEFTSIDTGECKSTGKLRLAGQKLWGGTLGSLKLPGRWTLDPPMAFYGVVAAAE